MVLVLDYHPWAAQQNRTVILTVNSVVNLLLLLSGLRTSRHLHLLIGECPDSPLTVTFSVSLLGLMTPPPSTQLPRTLLVWVTTMQLKFQNRYVLKTVSNGCIVVDKMGLTLHQPLES